MKILFYIYTAWMGCIIPLTGQITYDVFQSGIESQTNTVLDNIQKGAEGSKNNQQNTNSSTQNTSTSNETPSQTSGANTNNNGNTSPAIKAYQNFDFVAGDQIIFEDNFSADMDGEFAAHWELISGQAVVNSIGESKAMLITDGNYGTVKPRIKTESYLGPIFTIELDYYDYRPADGSGSYPLIIQLGDKSNGEYYTYSNITIGSTAVTFSGTDIYFQKEYPQEISGDEKFCNTYHHISIAVKNRQMKIYVDQYRILVVPDIKADMQHILISGIGEDEYPVIFKNVKIANGGDMNMLDKLTTDGKIITHGITFDVNKYVIRPESMGTLNQIAKLMKDNPAIQFEIGGYTDSDGDATANQQLSEKRANAVKEVLISLGIAADRLTVKGYGENSPISDNTTPEGKANNRRVEFKKLQ